MEHAIVTWRDEVEALGKWIWRESPSSVEIVD
jgi:hypothetical protein